jgi:hypothetical protein
MISEEKKQQIFELRKQGKGILEIGIILKLGKATVYEWCNRFDPEKKYNLTNKITIQQKKDIVNYYLEHKSLKKTIKEFNYINKITLRNILINSGNYIFRKKENFKEKSRRKSLNVINWKKDKKKKLIEYKGGKCQICGYNKCEQALDFHHINPKEKDFDISSNSYSFDKMKKEADKCALLCATCHREVHTGIVKLELP